MMAVKAFITRHPVLTYFALTFAISWGGVLIVVGPDGFPGTPEQFQTLLPIAVVAMILGPSVTGILLIGVIDGKTGLREFLSGLLEWRVGARWYAAALLIAPTLMMAVLLALSLFSPEFFPGILVSDDKTTLVLLGILMHLSLTASARIIGAPGLAGLPLLTFDVVWFAAVWIVVATVAVANGWHLPRQPLRRRVT